MFDQIEKLKQDFTDKYVVVEANVPELMRFEGHVGQVKTVNMSGRALVQFDAWSNIGWYDIDVDYLKVVPKPAGPAEAKRHEAKGAPIAKPAAKPAIATGEKKLSPLEMARMQGAAKGAAAKTAADAPLPAAKPPAAAAGAKKSTAEILAAARAAKAGADQPPPTAKPKLSTADSVAAARAKQAPVASAPAAQPAVKSVAEQAAAEEAPVPAPTATVTAKARQAPSAPAMTPGQRPTVAEILVWCRQHDSK